MNSTQVATACSGFVSNKTNEYDKTPLMSTKADDILVQNICCDDGYSGST